MVIYRDLLKSQSNAFVQADFEWRSVKSRSNTSKEVLQLFHKPTNFYFIFDYQEQDFMVEGGRLARFAPGAENPAESALCQSWEKMLNHVDDWLRYIKRETIEPDLWNSHDYESFNSWALPNRKFTEDELLEIKKGLKRVEQLLIDKSDKSEKTLNDISASIKYLEQSSLKSGRRDWYMMFVGVIVSKLADWGVSTLPWQIFVSALLKGVKGIWPGAN